MNRQLIAEQYGEELLFLDPPEQFDSCIIGVANRCGMDYVVVYDEAKIVEALMSDGMSEEQALEHFDFNIAGSYVGERTPMFLSVPEAME